MSAAILSSFRQSCCIPRMQQHLLMKKRFMSSNYLKMKSALKDGPTPPLLGPPELYQNKPSPVEEETTCNKTTENNLNNITISSSDRDDDYGYTENNSPTHLTSGNPFLDFFFHVVPNTDYRRVGALLKKSWEKDPMTSLKLVMNLAGVRGTGKSDREGFYKAALWLHENHPKTLAYNAEAICKFGYFKNVLEIPYRLLKGEDTRRKEYYRYQDKLEKKEKGKSWWMYYGEEPKTPRVDQMKVGLEKYQSDESYRFLHNAVSYVFAEAMKKDMELMKSGKIWDISYAAKWCPSIDKSYDRAMLFCESIGRRMFPKDLPEYEDVEDAHYAYRVRERLRKEVLGPLRMIKKVPEVFMSAGKWGEVFYSRVPSIAMKNYKDLFMQHDEERFQKYLEDVKKGKKKIAAGALLPHQIIQSVLDTDDYESEENIDTENEDEDDEDEVAELQWKRMVDDLSKYGKLNNCMAISDVSGSMNGRPLLVSIALGMMVSELSEEPWKGKLITFSEKPELHLVQGETLREKVNFVNNMNWNMNTDFQKVFDRILEVAESGNLSQDQMIKRLFVFSDMEFDQASLNPWETDYEVITRKFKDSGYETVPEIVFWNLRDSMATPVPSTQKGVALVSGFSRNLIKVFMKTGDFGDVINPEDTMMKAISGKEYQGLIIVD